MNNIMSRKQNKYMTYEGMAFQQQPIIYQPGMKATGTIEKDKAGHIYYNITIPHNDDVSQYGEPTPATFSKILNPPIIDNASDYYMAIVRFQVPTGYIPIQLIPILPYPNTDPNKTLYSVTLQYGSDYYQEYIIWQPQDLTTPTPPAPLANEGPIRKAYYQYYSLYSFQRMTDLINVALSDAFTALKTAHPSVSATVPPFLKFDSSTKLFRLYVDQNFNTDPITLYFNNALNVLFDTSFNTDFITWNSPDGANVKYIINTQNIEIIDSVDYYYMDQEFNSLPAWLTFSNLVFLTNTVPIRKEYITLQTNGKVSETPANPTFPILTDFVIDFQSGFEIRNSLTYYPTAQYRYIDLDSNSPIQSFDVSVYWQDNYSNIYPLLIPAHQVLTIKVLFAKKSLVEKS